MTWINHTTPQPIKRDGKAIEYAVRREFINVEHEMKVKWRNRYVSGWFEITRAGGKGYANLRYKDRGVIRCVHLGRVSTGYPTGLLDAILNPDRLAKMTENQLGRLLIADKRMRDM